VPQGVVNPAILQQTRLALESALAVLAQARAGRLRLSSRLVMHHHLCSLDLPRHGDCSPRGVIHPLRHGRDWQPLRPGDPLFLSETGETLPYEPPSGIGSDPVWPVFINEAAYGEKGIALSLTRRRSWPVQQSWAEALEAQAARLTSAG
jgi:aspartoacylase